MRQPLRTVLVVDDSSEDREFYRRYLQRDPDYSYTILEASLGQQGLDLWQQQRPDVVLLDYRLPDLDGLEFLAQLPSPTPQPCFPVIMMTGQGTETLAVQALKAGAQDYLIKELITPEGLHQAINGAIETVRLRTELHQRIERERLVRHITQQIHQSLDLDHILQTTVTEVRQFLNTDRALVFQLQPDGNGTVVAESVDSAWQSLLSSTIYDPCLAENYLRFSSPGSITHDPEFVEDYVKHYRQGQVTAIPDIHASDIDPCHIELLARFQVRANLVVPILHDDLFWGLLIAHQCTAPRLWQPLDIGLLKELATQVGLALRQAELYQQSQTELAERKRVEAALRESEEQLKSALTASRMGTWDWNIQTGHIQWSDNLEAMFGLEPGAFDGSFQMFSERLHPEDHDRVLAAVERTIATGEDYSIEFRVVYPDGTVRWALSQGQVFYDQNGQPIRMAGNDIDITDRKQAELNQHFLSDLDWQLRQHADAAEMVWEVVSQLGPYLQVDRCLWHEIDWQQRSIAVGRTWHSPAVPDVAGIYTLDEFFGAEQLHQFEAGHPLIVNDVTTDSGTASYAQNYLPLGVAAFVSIPCIYAGRWVALLAVNSRTPRRWRADEVALLQEIVVRLWAIIEQTRSRQALQEQEERTRLATEAVQLGMWFWDLVKDELVWTDRCKALFGLAPEVQMTYEVFLNALHPDDRDRTHAAVTRALEQKVEYDVEYRTLWPDGSVHWIVAKGRGFYDTHNRPVRMMGTAQDISDRKRAEEALQSSEARFRQLAENIDAVFWMKEVPENRVSYVSPAYERLWGLNPQELYESQQSWINYIHPDDREVTDRAFWEKAAIGQFDQEYRIVLPEGQTRWVRDRCFPIQNQVGETYRFTGIAEDVTDRKQIEEMLRLQAQILDQTHDSVVTTNLDGYITSWNKGAERVLGYTAAEMLGQHIAVIYPPETHEFLENQVITPLKVQGKHEVEVLIRRKSGEPLNLLLSLSLLRDKHQNEIGMIGFSMDITDRKRSEQALRESEEFKRRMLDSSSDCIKVLDIEGRLLYMNTGGACLLEIDDIAPYLNQNWTGFWQGDDLQAAEAAIGAARAGERARFQGFCPTAKGTSKWWDVVLTPILNIQGQVIQLLATSRDITERKQAEIERDRLLEQEQAARADAERANRIKDEFLAVLSHELRSPLNPILGWTKLMQSRKFDPTKTAAALATIERNVKLQTQLIDDLLDVAKILRGKLRMETVSVDLAFVIEAAIDTVRAAAVAKDILLRSVLPQIGRVSGDAARLQQIIWNLLSNAIKFTDVGGLVEIRLEREGNQAKITVSDTGKGINPDFLPHIFESFRQEDASTTRQYGGLGLGLAIVRSLVEAHGGTISAVSPGEGQGALFTIQLPLLDSESVQTTSEAVSSDDLDLTGLRILAVDDEPDARELLTILLTQYGAEVLTVGSATEVLANLESFQPDVLVNDLGMPKIDGYMLIQQIRALPPEQGGQIPAIALTAYTREEDQQRSLTSGYQRHIAKPLEPHQLVQAILSLARPN